MRVTPVTVADLCPADNVSRLLLSVLSEVNQPAPVHQDLAGFPCPAMGGPARTQLTPKQREADYDVRVCISAELGHAPEEMTRMYLERW